MTSSRQTAVSDKPFPTSTAITTRGTHRMSPSPARAISGFARVRLIVLTALAALMLVAVAVPATALGAQTRLETSTFDGSDTDAGAFGDPGRVAVHQASGTVYVIDAAAGAVDKFDASGTAQDFSALGSSSLDGSAVTPPDGPTTFSLFSESDIAVDNSGTASDGNLVVVADGQQTAWVFDASGTYLHRITGFGYPCGAAVDSDGHVWIADLNGQTVVEHDASGAATGVSVNTSGQGFPCHIAFDADDNLYVALYGGAVEKYDPAGAHLAQIDPDSTRAVTVDPGTGHVFAVHSGRVSEYDASGALLGEFGASELSGATGIAVGPGGEVYVSDKGDLMVHLYGPPVPLPAVTTGAASAIEDTTVTLSGVVDPDGVAVTDCHFEYTDEADFQANGFANATDVACVPDPGAGSEPVDVSADVTGLTGATAYRFRLVAANANAPYAGADQAFTTAGAPSIDGLRSPTVDFDSATLAAEVNPNSRATTYHFEYGTSASYGQATPESDSIGSDMAGHPATATLTGLASGTTYHWRVVATNSVGTTTSADRTFTTLASSSGTTDCPNQRFRTGAAASLADCRAYEMVSPVDKQGSDIRTAPDNFAFRTELNQSSTDGDKITYSSYKAFGDSLSSPYSSQYIASRGAGGWSTHGLNPPRDQTLTNRHTFVWDTQIQFKAFTDDLAKAWLTNNNAVPLTSDAPQGQVNIYERDNTSDSYRAITIDPLPPSSSDGSAGMLFVGHSADGSHAVFSDNQDGTFVPNGMLYDFTGGELRVVSVLPDGTVSNTATAGSASYGGYDPTQGLMALEHAVSDDGSRIFWSSGGSLYVRVAGETTIPISTTGDAFFRQASADGSRVIFETGSEGSGSLYEMDVDTQTQRLIADRNLGVLGASDDLSRIYFASRENLAAGATEGENNLYLDEDGAVTFIAVLSDYDVTESGFIGRPNSISRRPVHRVTRVNPDGGRLLFQSTRSLTGYDNTDAVTDDADIEVFTYDADADRLTCVSCNPSGASPVGQPLRLSYTANDGVGPGTVRAAAWIPASKNSLYSSRVITGDGSRVFFNSFDALVPHDTNALQDVYEWRAAGTGDCQQATGCVSLISSGTSPQASEFVDASADGRDVFFATAASLVSQDTGSVDIYDARVGGGFDSPPAPVDGCGGETCQADSPAPRGSAPASSGLAGAGNVKTGRRVARADVSIVRKAAGSAGVALRVKVSGKGVITGTGTGLRSRRKRVAKAGTYRIVLTLTDKARRALARGDAPKKVRVRVRFAAGGGKTVGARTVLRLEQPKRAPRTRAAKNDSGGAK